MKLNDFSNFLTKAVASVFFIGYLPLMPGTFGTVAGIGLFYLFKGASQPAYFSVILCVIILGFLTGGRMEKLINKKDPSCVVIDEVMGMLVALSFMPYDLKIIILAFLIFRILDTLKPFPVGRLQYLHGASGIMIDDLVAGIYTNIVLQVILKLASFKTA
ncbi:MAG: phosphatidylglycerophosphatase A [Candidatus Omnitrophica bacterium CG11_big_fil_rev_8_21_14_0_20_41_12]|nr:MAG: phosphatidylglycerophosphatase A [Candidatus Omnitrophica bacterium CG11_big_fil_rev_8_21_14_0_20_41_12]